MKLLSTAESNEKLRKSTGRGYLVAGLSLRPADLSGRNVCPWATKGCRNACVLEHSGRGNMDNVRTARDRKTSLFFDNRPEFLRILHADLIALERKAERLGMIPVVRLNVASDLPWERIDRTIFTDHATIRFYDYTKGAKRFNRPLPENYSLLYSWNEDSSPDVAADILRRGHNVAMVFDTIYKPAQGEIGKLPELHSIPGRLESFPVVDGDRHDLRLAELDGTGVIVGLRGKGGKAIVREGVDSGFIVPTIGGVAAAA